eukprot:GCRY01002033.1.p1 GENE.GCRY01002033.1~~GCRY01002033.1.p1  ORF type:complete len:713 (+),score=98.61 GCRY01002033.1:32-2140(+)
MDFLRLKLTEEEKNDFNLWSLKSSERIKLILKQEDGATEKENAQHLEEDVFFIPKLLFVKQSEVFERMFAPPIELEMKEVKRNEVIFPDVPSSTLTRFVRYISGGDLDFTDLPMNEALEQIFLLLLFAKRYMITGLSTKIEALLEELIQSPYCLPHFLLMHEYISRIDCPNLLKAWASRLFSVFANFVKTITIPTLEGKSLETLLLIMKYLPARQLNIDEDDLVEFAVHLIMRFSTLALCSLLPAPGCQEEGVESSVKDALRDGNGADAKQEEARLEEAALSHACPPAAVPDSAQAEVAVVEKFLHHLRFAPENLEELSPLARLHKLLGVLVDGCGDSPVDSKASALADGETNAPEVFLTLWAQLQTAFFAAIQAPCCRAWALEYATALRRIFNEIIVMVCLPRSAASGCVESAPQHREYQPKYPLNTMSGNKKYSSFGLSYLQKDIKKGNMVVMLKEVVSFENAEGKYCVRFAENNITWVSPKCLAVVLNVETLFPVSNKAPLLQIDVWPFEDIYRDKKNQKEPITTYFIKTIHKTELPLMLLSDYVELSRPDFGGFAGVGKCWIPAAGRKFKKDPVLWLYSPFWMETLPISYKDLFGRTAVLMKSTKGHPAGTVLTIIAVNYGKEFAGIICLPNAVLHTIETKEVFSGHLTLQFNYKIYYLDNSEDSPVLYSNLKSQDKMVHRHGDGWFLPETYPPLLIL